MSHGSQTSILLSKTYRRNTLVGRKKTQYFHGIFRRRRKKSSFPTKICRITAGGGKFWNFSPKTSFTFMQTTGGFSHKALLYPNLGITFSPFFQGIIIIPRFRDFGLRLLYPNLGITITPFFLGITVFTPFPLGLHYKPDRFRSPNGSGGASWGPSALNCSHPLPDPKIEKSHRNPNSTLPKFSNRGVRALL